ncbi:hypothetical protein MTO96_036014 [Rhipicephalus appendiculatus]
MRRQGVWNLSVSFTAQFPGAPGKVALFEFCASPVCLLPQHAGQCLALTQRALYTSQSIIPVSLFQSVGNIREALLWGSARGPGPNGTCLVLYDIDLDAYDQPCGSSAYWPSLRHLEIALAMIGYALAFWRESHGAESVKQSSQHRRTNVGARSVY